MSRKIFFVLCLAVGLFLIVSCGAEQTPPTAEANLANPASVYCEENGGMLKLRQDASGGVSGVCIFPDGSECDEWAFFRGECNPAEAENPAAATQVEATVVPPTDFPTPMPIDAADYQGWWTYTNPAYGFSFLLPSDWVVDETAVSDPLMNGHLLNLHPQDANAFLNIRVTFRHSDEDFPLWPTGVGAGKFVEQDTLAIAGEDARRILFVCPTGQVNAIWYHGVNDANIQRGDMAFGFIFSYTQVYCEEGYSLEGKNQRVGEMILASLQVP